VHHFLFFAILEITWHCSNSFMQKHRPLRPVLLIFFYKTFKIISKVQNEIVDPKTLFTYKVFLVIEGRIIPVWFFFSSGDNKQSLMKFLMYFIVMYISENGCLKWNQNSVLLVHINIMRRWTQWCNGLL